MTDKQEVSKRYLIKAVTQEHVNEIFRLFKEQFMTPLMDAYYERNPQKREYDFSIMWDEDRRIYIKEVVRKNISLGCFDQQNHNELVGVILVQDSLIQPQALKRLDYLRYRKELKEQLYGCVSPKYLQIIESQQTPIVDHWYFYIKNEHRGKGLLNQMVAQSDFLASSKNYQHSVCWASSCHTAKTMKKLGYRLIGQTNAKQLICQGLNPFEKIKQQHQIQTLWFKSFSPILET